MVIMMTKFFAVMMEVLGRNKLMNMVMNNKGIQ